MIVSDKLARMLMLMVDRLALKGNWRNYSFIEDMKAEAICQLVKCNEQHRTGQSNDYRPNVLKFDTTYAQRTGKSQNPFAYITQIVTNSFRRSVKVEGALQDFRDDVLLEERHIPSARRQFEDEMNRSSEPIPIKRKPRPPTAKKR